MTTKPLAPTPMLKPGTYTAEQVLKFVIQIIEERPLRLNMKDWISAKNGIILRESVRLPACGTVACISGWIGIATEGVETYGFGNDSLEVLGLKSGPWGENLTPAGEDLSKLFHSTKLSKTKIVSKLKYFVRKHKTILRNNKVIVEAHG